MFPNSVDNVHRQQYERSITIAAYSGLLLQSVHFSSSENYKMDLYPELNDLVKRWEIDYINLIKASRNKLVISFFFFLAF